MVDDSDRNTRNYGLISCCYDSFSFSDFDRGNVMLEQHRSFITWSVLRTILSSLQHNLLDTFSNDMKHTVNSQYAEDDARTVLQTAYLCHGKKCWRNKLSVNISNKSCGEFSLLFHRVKQYKADEMKIWLALH